MTPAFPFSALVGQEDLREALLACAVDPRIGGVLVRGERGTAKSTAVRGLASLLPPVRVVAGARYASDPDAGEDSPDGPAAGDAEIVERPVALVELPVGATADRVLGTLDLDRALADGTKAFEPGLLAAAHRGILYVDEVNLLPDHLVDVLLDAAAMGRVHVEREGLSVSHPARFVLVGTMNPEEGDLRPQLLDRFGLSVEVTASGDPAERTEVVRRRLAYDADPEGFAARFGHSETELAGRVLGARDRLGGVALSDRALTLISSTCARLGVDGLRADIVCARAACALAALDGASEVGEDHIRRAALLALAHRRRRGPLEAPGLDEGELDDALERSRAEGGGLDRDPDADADPDRGSDPDREPDPGPGPGGSPPQQSAAEPPGAPGAGTDASPDRRERAPAWRSRADAPDAPQAPAPE
ncbi:MAG: ATP-binding protein, partial [Thermoleophilaceae bacterium]